MSGLFRRRERASRWHPLRRAVDVTTHFVIVPLIVLAVMLAMREFLGRGTTLGGAFTAIPDAVLLLAFAFALDLAQAGAKLWMSVRGGSTDSEDRGLLPARQPDARPR